MKTIILTVSMILWVFTNFGYSQNYLNFADQIGINHSSDDLLEDKTNQLIEVLPEEFQDSFKVFSLSIYLHSEDMENSINNSWQTFIDSISPISEYYIAFLIISSDNYLHRIIQCKVNLFPSNSLSQCYDDQAKDILLTNLNTKLNESINVQDKYSVELNTLDYLTDKFNHYINCCNTINVRNDYCEDCFKQIDDIESNLTMDGYVNINKIFSSMLSCELDVIVNSKEYSTINSDYEIIFSNNLNGINYNFTDGLEYYYNNNSSTLNYNVEVAYYDDDIESTNIECFDSIPVSPTRSSYDLNESIIILHYNNNYYIYSKLTEYNIESYEKLPVYLYNATHSSLNSEPISDIKINQIMVTAFNDAKTIYEKNSFDIFTFELISLDEDHASFVPTNRNFLYCFKNTRRNLQATTHAGISAMEQFRPTIMEKCNGMIHPSYIDMAHFILDYKTKPYAPGYALAHELLHVLIIRGASKLHFPLEKYIADGTLEDGHWNPVSIKNKDIHWPVNLLTAGPQIDIPKPKNELNPEELILMEQRYFIIRYYYGSN